MTAVVVLIVLAACAAGGAAITRGKGRGSAQGALIGVLLGVLGLVICACLPKTTEQKARELAELRALIKD